jgi:hypothetical protein
MILALFAKAPDDKEWGILKSTPRSMLDEPMAARMQLEQAQREWMFIEPTWSFKIDVDQPSSYEYTPYKRESNHGDANDQVRPRSNDEDPR